MCSKQSDDFTKNFIESGLKLSQMEIMRSRFILGPAEALINDEASFKPLKAADYFLAEILADPDKAEMLAPLFAEDYGLSPKQPAPDILPLWPLPAYKPFPKPLQDPTPIEPQFVALSHFQALSAALMAGAALAGAVRLDERFLYSHGLDGRRIKRCNCDHFTSDAHYIMLPDKANMVLIMAFVRSPEIMGLTPGVAQVKPKAGYLNLEEQIKAVLSVSQSLWDAGFIAIPSAGGLIMNDQHAALASMGELGRQGLLICPEYGPNIRLFSILTNYPFEEAAGPLNFGVAAYCNTCQRCINECPAKAVSDGQRRMTPLGLWQWPLDYNACFKNWLDKKEACRKCIEVCPYTKEPLSGSSGGRPNP